MSNIKNKQNDPKIKGQSSSFDNGNNPSGVASLKDSRKTNVSETGTKYLRECQTGKN